MVSNNRRAYPKCFPLQNSAMKFYDYVKSENMVELYEVKKLLRMLTNLLCALSLYDKTKDVERLKTRLQRFLLIRTYHIDLDTIVISYRNRMNKCVSNILLSMTPDRIQPFSIVYTNIVNDIFCQLVSLQSMKEA